MTALLLATLLTVAPRDTDVFSLPADAFDASVKTDLAQLRRWTTALHSTFERVQEKKDLFSERKSSVYSPEEKRTLLSTWGSLFSYFSAIEGLRQKYWGFVKLPPTDARHAWGFVLTHTALTAILAHGMGFADLALNNKQLETLFDEPSDEFGMPRGSFAAFKLKAIHVATSTQLVTGDAWAASALPALKKLKALDQADVKWAWEAMQANSRLARSLLLKQGARLFAGNMKDLFKDTTAQAIFPAQKTFAEWAGDARVARNGRSIITREQVDALVLPRLQPGDVVVSRMNWFLSNIALPGFWPHAQLYVGTAKDLAAAFDDDPEVKAWVKAQPEKVEKFTELLARRYAEKWKAYNGPDFQGHSPVRIIESISEGVSFTAVEHAYGVDYLGAMRPKVSKTEKARAIERAFKYQGRPYDFDFDFFSDATLVCTELVWKSYQPSADMKGLAIDLVDVAGRRTLPANELVHRFDAEYDKPGRQLDFVLFLDAREKKNEAFDADVTAFRNTWKRVKWDVAQQ